MKYKTVLCAVFLLVLAGCAAREEDPFTVREPKKLFIQDDYQDLQTKPRPEEPVEVDYTKEGVYRQNFENVKIKKEE